MEWCRKSYTFFKEQSADRASGIRIIPLIKAAKAGAGDEDTWIQYMPANSLRELAGAELPQGYAKAFEAQVPLIETQLFLPYLQQQLVDKGVSFVQREITDLDGISQEYDIVVNCTGLGARELCNDATIFAVKGQVALLEPGYPDHIFLDNQTPSYIVPRKDATIVGGTYEEHNYDAHTVEEDLQQVLAKAYHIMPALRERKIIGSWAGLRPFRQSVRLERESNIIHNYGHGGSGFTLSFGCAEEVASLV
ncbi:FAD dependent oxidoreductase-domain-containing protein [Russula earlei]|uniref:FAD dependent oxidoreductase-domain-containing protein n=1 Tax=Russula earlei TaxID=71964 RepID=A0ACC0TTT4_9AGAM|nr:FAD dependent oxidoreductase-domain-containing protein [Russula earlei]